MTIKTYNISLTKLVSEVLAGSGLTRDMVLNDLIKRGYLKNIRTATGYGLKNGVVMVTGRPDRPGEKPPVWPTYVPAIQKYYVDHVDDIRKANGLPPLTAENKPEEPKMDALTREAMAWIATIRDEPISKTQKIAEQAQDTRAKTENIYPKKELHGQRQNILEKARYSTIITDYRSIGMPEDFVVVDTETTGLSNDDEIIELSVVSKMGDILYHSYFMPTKTINPGAAAVNHITMDMLKRIHAPRFKDEWAKIKVAIGGRPILGHNIKFDARLVQMTLGKYEIDPREGADAFRGMFDSQVIAKNYISASSYKLCNLAHMVGITREEQHDSSDDCRMTVEFLSRLDRILSGIESSAGYREILKERYEPWNYTSVKGVKN